MDRAPGPTRRPRQGGNTTMAAYPRLFSEWKISQHHDQEPGGVPAHLPELGPPTRGTGSSSTWRTHYYRERAEGGVGLIIIGGTHVHKSSLMAPLLMPQLFDDRQIEPLSKIADAVHAEGCKLAIQLWHSGVRGFPTFKQEATYDPDATWYSVSPSQVPLGEFPGASTPKELDEDEIEELLAAFGSAAERAFAAGARRGRASSQPRLPALAVHLAALQQAHRPLGRLAGEPPALPARGVEADAGRRRRRQLCRCGYRINSTSFWPGDLEIDEVRGIVAEIEQRADIDYVNVSAGVHHAFIHTPMEFEAGWERGYVRARSARSRRSLCFWWAASPRRTWPSSCWRRATATPSASRASSSPTPTGPRRPKRATPTTSARASPPISAGRA